MVTGRIRLGALQRAPGLGPTTGILSKQETDDAKATLKSCVGEPARQLSGQDLLLGLSLGPGSLASFSRINLFDTCALLLRALSPLHEREHMNRKRVSKKRMQSLCGEVHPDDGVEPAEFFRKGRKKNPNHHKAQQLCHQVADTLSLVLNGDFGEELRDLRIVAVTPAPDASQLLVLVAPAVAGDSPDPDAVLARLAAAAGCLRSEIAGAITRRRAPKLLFQFVAGQSPTEVQP